MAVFKSGSRTVQGLAVLTSCALLWQYTTPPASAQNTVFRVDASLDQDKTNDIGRIASARVKVTVGGQPVTGAVVVFHLDDNGVFQKDSSRQAAVETDVNGQAAAPGICPIESGDFSISVTATVNGERS